jgi:hypothetical protein
MAKRTSKLAANRISNGMAIRHTLREQAENDWAVKSYFFGADGIRRCAPISG